MAGYILSIVGSLPVAVDACRDRGVDEIHNLGFRKDKLFGTVHMLKVDLSPDTLAAWYTSDLTHWGPDTPPGTLVDFEEV